MARFDSTVRWRIALLLFLVTVINYIDRQSFAIAAPVLLEELSLSQVQYGTITSAFLIAYAIGQGLSGRIIDLMGTKRAFSWAVSIWSLACALHAFGRGFYSFMGLRAVLGVFEAANHPTAIKVISEWFPARERSMGVGIFLAGASFGAMVAPPLLGTLIFYVGWQWTFAVAGAIGFVWVVVWRWYFAPPEEHPGLAAAEREHVLSGRSTTLPGEPRPSIRKLMQRREVAGLMLARFVGDNIFIFFTFWLPIYLANERGLSILEVGYFAWIPFLFTDLGSLAAGWFGGRLMKLGFSLNAARKIMLWMAAVLVPISVLAVFADEVLTAVLLIGFAMFFNQFKSVVVVGLPADLFPARDVATVWGWLGAAGSFGGFLFAPVVGYLVDNYSFLPVFMIVALLPACSATIITLFVPDIKPLAPEPAPA